MKEDRPGRPTILRGLHGVVIVVAGVYGLINPTQSFGIFCLVTAGIAVALDIVTLVGMRRPEGSRFALGWHFWQRAEHPYQAMSQVDAQQEWRLLGQPSAALLGGWRCRGHCETRLLVGETSGRRYYVYDNVAVAPWAQWAAGYLIVFGKDRPMADVPVAEVREA